MKLMIDSDAYYAAAAENYYYLSDDYSYSDYADSYYHDFFDAYYAAADHYYYLSDDYSYSDYADSSHSDYADSYYHIMLILIIMLFFYFDAYYAAADHYYYLSYDYSYSDNADCRTRLEIEKTKDQDRVKVYRGKLNNELIKAIKNTEQNLEDIWNIFKDSINKSAEVFKKENAFNGKRAAEKRLIQKIEEHRLNPRLFFKKCRSVKEGFKAQTRMVKDHEGNLITDEEGIIQKFQAHFKNILNVDQEIREENKLIDLIKARNARTVYKLEFCNSTSDSFDVSTELKQDDTLSPDLFNLTLEKVIRSIPMHQGIYIWMHLL
ncbi:Hypothetical protein CINCED_3A021044 [Cinara cedri]|uniref:Uncharacterized protein n=1 Tax=Cinara cedri TaxID=506608 RepID=A0A5E4NCV3_9HEMI|nr:Hypothetical protein CINCED_3A021044 [Cinara cedri]